MLLLSDFDFYFFYITDGTAYYILPMQAVFSDITVSENLLIFVADNDVANSDRLFTVQLSSLSSSVRYNRREANFTLRENAGWCTVTTMFLHQWRTTYKPTILYNQFYWNKSKR